MTPLQRAFLLAQGFAEAATLQDAGALDSSLAWNDSPTLRADSATIHQLAEAIAYIHAQASCTEFDAVELLNNIKARTTQLGA